MSSDLLTPAIQTEKPHFFSVTGQQTDVNEIGISSPQQNLDPLQLLATAFFDGDGPGSSTFSDEISIRTALCKDRAQTELESFSNQKKMAESGMLSVSLRHCKRDRKPLSPFFSEIGGKVIKPLNTKSRAGREIYDYIYNTMDKSSDALYESMLDGKSDMPHVVHLSHPTTIHSIYHLRLGFAHVASKPYDSKGELGMLWPFTWSSMLVTWLFGSTFTVEKIKLNKLKMQTWAIPRYSFQYMLSWQRNPINNLIEKAILEAEQEGVKVISLGLLNQGEELNRNGELYLLKHPKLKVRIVDGSSLAAAVVLKSIPQGTKQVLLQGSLSKVGYAITLALCQRGVQVWLVGDGLREEEQRKAPKGTKFIPFSQFPMKKIRKDCTYFYTPAMVIPKDLENMQLVRTGFQGG